MILIFSNIARLIGWFIIGVTVYTYGAMLLGMCGYGIFRTYHFVRSKVWG